MDVYDRFRLDLFQFSLSSFSNAVMFSNFYKRKSSQSLLYGCCYQSRNIAYTKIQTLIIYTVKIVLDVCKF